MFTLLSAALSWTVAAILAGWVILTILNQEGRTRRLVQQLVSRDIFGLIPVWTFFAPNPGDTDTHLLFRDRDPEGRISDWREVWLAGRRNMADLWRPERRMQKALVDVVFELTKLETQVTPGPQAVSKKRVLSFPYLLILNYVSHLEGDFAAVERQFAIAKTQGIVARNRPDVLLVSAFHSLK